MTLRKYYTQMTAEEIGRIQARLNQLHPKLTRHAQERLQEKQIELTEIRWNGNVVEFNRLNGGVNALLRQENGICYVESLIDGNVLTVFKNNAKDNHETLDWKQYTRQLHVGGW